MIVIVDYGMGNLGSIVNMLKKAGSASVISSDPTEIGRADKLILPGVGAFDAGMKNLSERGLIPVLHSKVIEQKTPILGLCLGLQLFTRASTEGQLPGLGWLDAETVRFQFGANYANMKIPHMGWNNIQICHPHQILANLDDEARFYFVHSYHVVCKQTYSVIATAMYGYSFPAVVALDNIIGMQFHPEKSHRYGTQLLKNFIVLT